MRASIHMIPIGSLEIKFFFDQDDRPVLEIENRNYTSLFRLFEDFPHLSNPVHKEKVSQLITFLLTGLEFQWIENIEKFREDYEERIESDLISLGDGLSKLSDYGVYDLSVMHPPTVSKGKFIFFVKDENQIPYKVSLPFPVKTEDPQASYELLPYLSQ